MLTPHLPTFPPPHFPTHLVLFEVGTNPPAFVVGEGMSVLLKEGVNAGNATVPGVLQIFQCQTSVLSIGLLTLESVFCPHTLAVNKLTLPWLDVAVWKERERKTYERGEGRQIGVISETGLSPVEVRNELVLIVAHARPEVGDSDISLLGPAEVRLWDEHVPH